MFAADNEQPATISQPVSYTTSFVFTQDNFVAEDSLASHVFSGNTTINVRILETTRKLLLHSVGQTFSSVNFGVTNEQSRCLCGEECQTNCTTVVTDVRLDP